MGKVRPKSSVAGLKPERFTSFGAGLQTQVSTFHGRASLHAALPPYGARVCGRASKYTKSSMESVAGSESLQWPYRSWGLGGGGACYHRPHLTSHALLPVNTRGRCSFWPHSLRQMETLFPLGSPHCLYFLLVQLLCGRMGINRVFKEGSRSEKYK